MDALVLLKMDHDKLRDLFDAVSRTFNPDIQKLLFGEIRSILETHSEIEETIFYPAVENFSELNLFVKNSYQEHLHLKKMIRDLDASSVDPSGSPSLNEEWQLRMKRFLQYVDQHIEIEEEELFSKVEKLMPSADRLRLGNYMNQIRENGPGAAA